MSDILLAGAYAGGAAGVIMTLLSHVAPFFGAGNFIRDLDQPRVLTGEITRREAHVLGVLLHLVLSIVIGAVLAYGVERGWISGFDAGTMLGFVLLMSALVGGVVMPLEGQGFFGRRHDAWFAIDLVLTNFLWGSLYVMLVRLWV